MKAEADLDGGPGRGYAQRQPTRTAGQRCTALRTAVARLVTVQFVGFTTGRRALR